MRCLDLFSGIGGFALGLESLGMHTIGFCEIEPFPRAVLAHHWPGVPIHDDVRTLSAESVPWLRAEAARGIDLICGGFPCQDISVAGKGAGLSGARSGLWSECSRLVGELRPRWALFENVGALKQRGIDRVCADLEGHGYTVWPLLVGAGVGVGAPHRRERIWIVAHRSSDGLNGVDSVQQSRGVGKRERSEASREPKAGRTTEELAGGRSLGASELSNSDAGRRGREGDEVQAGRDEPERTDSAVGLADRDEQGQRSERGGRVQHGERAASRHDADGRGERPVGSPTGSGLEGQRADAGEAQEPEPRDAGALPQPEGERRAQQGNWRDAGSRLGCDGPRWPARPGEPQHEWEEPRLAFPGGADAGGRSTARGRRSGAADAEGDGTGAGDVSRRPELPLGGAAHGLPERLVRLAKLRLAERHARRHNREALKAYGNSVVPAVVAIIGQAILEADEGLR